MNNFTKRALTGTVFVLVLLASTLYHPLSFTALFFFFSIVGTTEYLNILRRDRSLSLNRTGAIIFSILCYLVFTSEITLGFRVPTLYGGLLIFCAFILLAIELFRLKANAFSNVMHSLAPGLLIAIPFGLFVSWGIRFGDRSSIYAYDPSFAILFFISLWSNDTGAYLSGKSFGKHKLFPVISPNKTWEGTIGGAVLAMIGAGIYSQFVKDLELIEAFTIALIVVVFGSLGDLVQSMLKRNYQVKDAGTIFPGHGGVLDRFDGLLLAAPMLFAAYELKELIELTQAYIKIFG